MTISRLYSTSNPYVNGKGKRGHHHASRPGERAGIKRFVAIDGEGINTSLAVGSMTASSHTYVLLGVGDKQISDSRGLYWSDVFDFIYGEYEPRTAFVGFYLAYDFTQWLRSFREDRAWRLLTIEGKESRRSRSPAMRGRFLPVDVDGWQVDMLGHKRMMFRPRVCDCLTMKCPHKKQPWLYVNDAGGFFQTAFVNVIDPAKWHDPIVTPDEYTMILAGKEHRPDAQLDKDMRRYNALENEVFQRVMHDLDTSLRKLGVSLSASQWFGPGQAAQAWMRTQQDMPTAEKLREAVPTAFLDAAQFSYFGGWFEIMAHGTIPGNVYEYDINSAYPYVISRLPCLLHGEYSTGTGTPPSNPDALTLVHTTVWTRPPGSDPASDHIGAMLHRDRHGRISRPIITSGWYWVHELAAAEAAGCVRRGWRARVTEWHSYRPCACLPPLRNVRGLYQTRKDLGKESSLGKTAKLIMNSIYGKTAQSLGMPVFANPVYASLITAGCRAMILQAIATHPRGKSDVVMVATDAAFFLTPHPALPLSGELGEWETKTRTNLTLFKPGLYWDDKAREAVAKGEKATFKSRGVSARAFSRHLAEIDAQFAEWTPGTLPELDRMADGTGWPRIEFPTDFALVSALQAIVRNEWQTAGTVETGKQVVQNSYPGDKRERLYADSLPDGRMIYRSNPLYTGRNAQYRHVNNYFEWDRIKETYESIPYEKRFGMDDPFSDEYTQSLGIVPDDIQPMRSAFRILTGEE